MKKIIMVLAAASMVTFAGFADVTSKPDLDKQVFNNDLVSIDSNASIEVMENLTLGAGNQVVVKTSEQKTIIENKYLMATTTSGNLSTVVKYFPTFESSNGLKYTGLTAFELHIKF